MRIPCKRVPIRFFFAFQTNEISLGRLNITVRHSFIGDMENIISNTVLASTFNS